MTSLSEHLLSTSSSLQAEVGIKIVKVEIPCSGRTSQEHRDKAFILNKWTIASKMSINCIVGTVTDSSFCDDGWQSFGRTLHESCGSPCNEVGPSKGSAFVKSAVCVIVNLWSDLIAAGTLDKFLSVCSVIYLIWWWISPLHFQITLIKSREVLHNSYIPPHVT